MEPVENTESIRLDKWLNVACILKTRSQATKACETGRVKVNDLVAKPSKAIRAGDKISVKYKSHARRFTVLGITNKSVSHTQARLLYLEHELTAAEKEELELRQMMFKASASFKPKYKGRPTKRERRQLDDFTNSQSDGDED
jgi:ribosome-associated heat shock protein Hsp15